MEEGEQLIVAATVGSSGSDSGCLGELLDEVKSNTGRKPERALADAGCQGEKNLKELERRKMRGYVALGGETKEGGVEPAADGADESAAASGIRRPAAP